MGQKKPKISAYKLETRGRNGTLGTHPGHGVKAMTKQTLELRKIKKVRSTINFELICTFDNNEVKLFDVKPLFEKMGPMLKPLQDLAYFKRVFLEMGVPTWPNGFDICADLIFMKAVPVKPAQKRTKKPAA